MVFCLRPLQHVADRGANQVPRWVRSIAQSIAGKTHVYKALKELEQESKRLKMKSMKAQASSDEAEKKNLKAQLEALAAQKEAAERRLAEVLAAQVEQTTKK